MTGGGRDLLALVACPMCRRPLGGDADSFVCEGCGARYGSEGGIPRLLPDVARTHDDEVEQAALDHKRRQAEYHDHHDSASEFELRRPRGTPALYEWQYEEKFRRSVTKLRPMLGGATALTVCGGSGMDGDFLARAGCRVVASDISLGAAQRTQERARRFGLPITAVVADVEALPFRDRAFDLVYVHDGLHHLENPRRGLREMGRVAAKAVSVTEPARAAATAVAVRLGLALEVEEAGNRVARLSVEEVGAVLAAEGLDVVAAQRYAMYFRHHPGKLIAFLSAPGIFGAMKAGLLAANTVIGRFGNKLNVQAVRRDG